MNLLFYIITLSVIMWGALIWYFRRGKKTNSIILFIMLGYLLSFLGAALVVALLASSQLRIT